MNILLFFKKKSLNILSFWIFLEDLNGDLTQSLTSHAYNQGFDSFALRGSL